MKKYITSLTGLAVAAAISTSAHAGELAFAPSHAPVANSQVGGEFSAWGMAVIPTNGLDDGSECDSGGTEFCATVPGWGGSASVYVPLNSNLSLSADVLYEFHFETNSDVDDRDDNPTYGALGVHLTRETNPDLPWGGFVFLASGQNHADEDTAGPVAGVGGEIMVGGFVVQAGGMFLLNPGGAADDTLENMYFIGGSKEFAVWNGNLTAGAMYGFGDFDESAANDPGMWAQVSLFYEAPLGATNMNWFAGYQGDFVHVDDGTIEQAMFHSVKLGITIPIGGGAGPFSTPNFRAPLVNAGEMN